jgi:hypothetical protein
MEARTSASNSSSEPESRAVALTSPETSLPSSPAARSEPMGKRVATSWLATRALGDKWKSPTMLPVPLVNRKLGSESSTPW